MPEGSSADEERTRDAPDAVLRWQPRFITDLHLTLGRAQQGSRDPVQQSTPDGAIWRTVRTPAGPATLRLRQIGTELRAQAWGPGAIPAVEAAPGMLGAADDPSAFVPRHPLLEQAHRRFPGLRVARTGDVLSAAIGAALEQRVEGTDAIGSWGRLIREIGVPAPGPVPGDMRVFPDGARWAAVPSWQWHRAGVDSRRRDLVIALARLDGSLQRLVSRPPAEVDRALTSIRGIGAWSSAEIRQRALGDVDAVSVGDFHLAAIVGQTLAGRPFTDAELVPFLEPWRPQRYRVARLIYALGIESLPRRAPRAPHRGGA